MKLYQSIAMRKAIITTLLVLAAGCAQMNGGSQWWHDKFNWQAEDYFDDPQVIALCKATEANDLEEMERLAQAGASPPPVNHTSENHRPIPGDTPSESVPGRAGLSQVESSPRHRRPSRIRPSASRASCAGTLLG